MCKELLEPIGILHQASSRAKKYDSLERNVTTLMSAFFTNNPTADEVCTSAKLNEEIKDRAGARILLYFPDDVGEVVEAISECPDFTIECNKIAVTKSRGYQPNDSQADYALMVRFCPSLSERRNIKGQRWEHYRYRAAHLVVKLSDGGPTKLNASAPEHLLTSKIYKVQAMCKPDLEPESSKSFIAYINSKKPKGDSNFGEVFKKVIGSKKTEIQLTTIVMHAWSHVEHDIVYKRFPGAHSTERIDRMLDDINGLSITSEILLRSFGKRNGKARKRLRHLHAKSLSIRLNSIIGSRVLIMPAKTSGNGRMLHNTQISYGRRSPETHRSSLAATYNAQRARSFHQSTGSSRAYDKETL
jgi:hypothetical protein